MTYNLPASVWNINTGMSAWKRPWSVVDAGDSAHDFQVIYEAIEK